MRLRPGRPDLNTYASRFTVPEASGDLSVTFMGVSTLLIADTESALMVDGFFSRPGLIRLATRRIAPDHARIDAALARSRTTQLEAVLPVHSHFDHVMDSPEVARKTGALLIGGESTAHVGRGHGLAEDRIRVVAPRDTLELGHFTVTWIESAHCPPDRFPGVIHQPVVPPARAKAYKCGEAWSLLVTHTSGRSALVQGSAGYSPGSLTGHAADVAYLGIGQLGVQSEAYIRTYWAETVHAVGAKQVVVTHWDDFFRGLDQPLRALPYAGDDLDHTMRILDEIAAEEGVSVRFPTLWRREDPWA